MCPSGITRSPRHSLCSMNIHWVFHTHKKRTGDRKPERAPFSGLSAAAEERLPNEPYPLIKQQQLGPKGGTTSPVDPRVQEKIHCLWGKSRSTNPLSLGWHRKSSWTQDSALMPSRDQLLLGKRQDIPSYLRPTTDARWSLAAVRKRGRNEKTFTPRHRYTGAA